MHIEEAHLTENRRAHGFTVLVHLRANFQTISAGDAARKRISLLLRLGSHARTFAEIVAAVDGNPGFDALQAFEHELAIDGEITNHGKFRHRLDTDGGAEMEDS